MTQCHRLLLCLLTLALASPAIAKKPKLAPDPAQVTEPQSPAEVPLPSDLNRASLRIAALDTLYQLDLSPDQLTALRSLVSADPQPRTIVEGNKKLTDLFTKMQTAILSDADDAAIAGLRNQIVDFINANNVELADAVHPTPAARTAAVNFAATLRSSQIAAFIALHADEVTDPVEQMNAAATSIRDAKAGREAGEDQATLITDTSTAVAALVAGPDDAKAKPISDQVAAWLKTASALSDADFGEREKALDDNARKIVAAPPMDVLSHWLQLKIALLLANPETPIAAQHMTTFRKPK